MQRYTVRFLTIVATVGASFLTKAALAVPQYRLTDLGMPGSHLAYYGGFDIGGINEYGTFVGTASYYAGSDSWSRVFRYSTGLMTDIGTMPGAYTSGAAAINRYGQIAGSAGMFGTQAGHGFTYDNGVWTDRFAALGGTNNYLSDISDAGHLAGNRWTGGRSTGFVHYSGITTLLGPLTGGFESAATAVNASGTVVGWSYTSGYSGRRAVRLANGALTNLGVLAGGESQARDINSQGLIVGVSSGRAVLWNGGSTFDLGTLGGVGAEAYAINQFGDVVGYAAAPNNFSLPGFLYSEGQMRNLNNLLDASGAGYFVYRGADISDNGVIVALAEVANTDTHLVVLTPSNLIVRPSGLAVTRGELLGGSFEDLRASDNQRVYLFGDPSTLEARIEISSIKPVGAFTGITARVETSVWRAGRVQTISMYDMVNGFFVNLDGVIASLSDSIQTVTVTSNIARFVGQQGDVRMRLSWEPVNDEDPAQDGWLHAVDEAYWIFH